MESLGIQAIVLIFYLILINIITFIVYGVDKKRARRKQWRVPEKVLFLLAIIGGSVGALLGMLVFRHKTQKWYFKFGIPAILLLQIAAALVVWKFFLS
ncbi:MAG: DUF1294 domain-containing protein [Lachnospiraceae bacterium]|nr:DUF1294 domain-containing protein [Lachnospiraceae bacterium]